MYIQQYVAIFFGKTTLFTSLGLGNPVRASMTEGALLALQKQFEEQYGKLEIHRVKKKKRKRTVEVQSANEVSIEWEQEWGGIQDVHDLPPVPKVVEFTETTTTNEVDTKSYKSFMVHFYSVHLC
jgi:hypothetical protein